MANRWRATVERELKGESADSLVTTLVGGIRVEPLYTDRPRPISPGVRTERVLLAAILGDARGTTEMRGWLADEIDGGAEALVVEPEICADPRFPRVLDPLEASAVAIVANVGASMGTAQALASWAETRGVTVASIGLDPLGAFARDGAPEPAQIDWRSLGAFVESNGGRPLAVCTEPYHDAGADAALELAYALATTAEILRRIEQSPALVATRLAWRFAVGRDVLVEIAKLRAASWVWRKTFAACGVSEPPAPYVVAVTSARTQTRRDPWVNVLRATTQAFAAFVGGASVIAVRPYDAALGVSDALARRLARNTLLVLRHECAIDAALDPGRGSYAIEQLTDQIARRAWELFRGIERDGGMAARLRSGVVKSELAARWAEWIEQLRSNRESITGVTEFADPSEQPLVRSARATFAAADAQRPCPLPRHRDAAAFERTAIASDGSMAWVTP